MRNIQSYLKLKNGHFLVLLISITWIIVYFQQEYLIIDQLKNFDVLGQHKEKVLEAFQKYRWLSFIFTPLLILLRIFYSSITLFLGDILAVNNQKHRFGTYFNVSIKADVIFLLSSLVLLLLIIYEGVDQAEVVFSYLSLQGLFNAQVIEPWLFVSLSSINIFEVIYWLFLAFLYMVTTSSSYVKSLKFVASTYGVGFLLYVILMSFIALYLTT